MEQKKILIIDDDPGIQKSLKEKLEEEGFIVLSAENAPRGLEEAINNHPDLILLDIVMPTVDGMTLLKALREDDWGKNVKVILLTNLREESKIAEAMELGSFDYLGIVEMIKEKLKS